MSFTPHLLNFPAALFVPPLLFTLTPGAADIIIRAQTCFSSLLSSSGACSSILVQSYFVSALVPHFPRRPSSSLSSPFRTPLCCSLRSLPLFYFPSPSSSRLLFFFHFSSAAPLISAFFHGVLRSFNYAPRFLFIPILPTCSLLLPPCFFGHRSACISSGVASALYKMYDGFVFDDL